MDMTTVIEPLYIKNRDIMSQSTRKATVLEICRAASEVVEHRYIEGAQIVRGVWKLYLKNVTAKNRILTQGLSLRGTSISAYESNPYKRSFDDTPVEKITIKDLPLSMPNETIEKFLKDHEELQLKTTIRFGKEKDQDGNWTNYKNGDRFVYAIAPIIPTLPRETIINGVPCRVFHSSQDNTCKACRETGHKVGDEECLALDRSGTIQPFKSHDNILSNFAPCKITYLGIEFDSLEHMYQWLKATDLGVEDIAEQIRLAKHAGAARAIARDFIDSDLAKEWEEKSVQTMYMCLTHKARQCGAFKEALIQSGENILVEATNNNFWAAGLDPYTVSMTKKEFWPGKNMLGDLLMKLRSNIQNDTLDNISHTDDTNNSFLNTTTQSSPIQNEGDALTSETQEENETQGAHTPDKQETQKEGTSMFKRFGSLFKSNTQLNKIDNYFPPDKKKRRATTSPVNDKSQKLTRKDQNDMSYESETSEKSPSLLASSRRYQGSNTNHKPKIK